MTRMNIFKNALMKSNGKFEARQEDETRGQLKDEIDGLELIAEDWISWLEDYSVTRSKVPVGTASSRNIMRVEDRSEPCDSHVAGSSRTIFQSTREPRKVSNLESIIRNFEKGYLSPSKKDKAVDEYKQKNFVKRIVEAFEVKYKINSKPAQEISKRPEGNKSNTLTLESWKRRSKIFCNPSKNGAPRSSQSSTNADESDGSALSSKDRIFHTSWNDKRVTRRRVKELENAKCSVKSKTILSAFGRKASGLELCSTFLRSSSDSSSPSNGFTRAELMRKVELSDLVKRLSLDKKMKSVVGPYTTSSEETICTRNESRATTSTLLESPKSDNSMSPEISDADKSPKVVGAFLKKPIDVENTFIEWVPVTGKRLPRKRSLRKLLRSFTSGKLMKRFSSERNLSEEPRESQDSEYDERSCSSMSLTSQISIADVLRHQENSHFEPNRRSDLKTFKPKKIKSNEEKGEASCDTYHSVENPKGKQLILTEVPREDVKLDLGPFYPSPSQTIRLVSAKDRQLDGI